MNIIHIGEIIEHRLVINEMEELYLTPPFKSLRNSTSIDIYVPEEYSSNDVKNILISTGLSEKVIGDIMYSFSKLEIKQIVEVAEDNNAEYIQKSPKKKKKRRFFWKLYKGIACFNTIK